MRQLKKWLIPMVSLTLAGCFDNRDTEEVIFPQVTLDQELQGMIRIQQIEPLTAPDSVVAADSAIAELGKSLFFSMALGGDMDTACASCHHPMLGGGDDLALPIGVHAQQMELLGPGRLHMANALHHDGGPTVPRNAPTTFNIALWQKMLFHDGRVENMAELPVTGGVGDPIRTPDVAPNQVDPDAGQSLASAQARFPVTSAEEMRGFDYVAGGSNNELRDALIERLRGNTNELSSNDWLAHFRQGFAQPDGSAEELITFANIVFAIGEYERSQVLINNPWHAYLNGQSDALSDAAKRGALLFYRPLTEGGFDCAGCHSGSFFTDESFHVIAVPQVGRGKGDGDTGDNDFGRFRETGDEKDKFAFRTPSLLNVTVTGPWGHDGAFASLEATIVHHLDPAQSLADFVPADVQPGIQQDNWFTNSELALQQLQQLQQQGLSMLPTVSFSEQDIADLAAFLHALEDPCVRDRSCMSKWIPDEDSPSPDSLRLVAVDKDGNLL